MYWEPCGQHTNTKELIALLFIRFSYVYFFILLLNCLMMVWDDDGMFDDAATAVHYVY